MNHVVVGILSRDRGGEQEYFLVSSKKNYGTSFGAYYPPGGHVENGEDERDALIREMKEELSLDVNPTRRIAEAKGDLAGQTVSWWECEFPLTEMIINTEEIADFGWFTRKEITSLTLWPATQKFFDQYIFGDNAMI